MITPDQAKTDVVNPDQRRASIAQFIDEAILRCYRQKTLPAPSESVLKIDMANIYPEFSGELFVVLEQYSQHWKYVVARDCKEDKVFLFICEQKCDGIDMLISSIDKKLLEYGDFDLVKIFTMLFKCF